MEFAGHSLVSQTNFITSYRELHIRYYKAYKLRTGHYAEHNRVDNEKRVGTMIRKTCLAGVDPATSNQHFQQFKLFFSSGCNHIT